MKNAIRTSLAQAIAVVSGLEEKQVFNLLERPKDVEMGDLAFPCFLLAKSWKAAAGDCAQQLSEKLSLPPSVEQANPVGPFLNFKLRRGSFVESLVEEIRKNPLEQLFERIVPGAPSEHVVLEYSSPNIAKPFHVGHLRATLIGNSLDRVYRRLGYPTVSINHLGDWGTQFGFVWAGCALWGKPATPTVKTLVELYRRATTLKEEQEKGETPAEASHYPDVNALARAYFLDLERGTPDAVRFWRWCSDISLEYLKKTYARLGIHFDHYTGESFYSDKLDAIKEELEASGLLKESQGALGVDLGEKLGFARVFTPDGRSLYLTRDLATAKYRAETFHFTKSLYVVGAPQALHFQQMKGILKALGRDYADLIEHIAFGHVIGMKTRGGGEIVELNEFIDEAYDRALHAYHSQVTKRPEGLDEVEVAEAVALAAIVFSNLSRNRIKDVHFSWDHALEFQGDTGPYLLYAYARLNGIAEKAHEAGIQASTEVGAEAFEDESAFRLASLLDDFSDALRKTVEENDPANLAWYALDLAKSFSKAYNELKVLGAPASIAGARLALFEATRLVLGESITLLGMKRIERM